MLTVAAAILAALLIIGLLLLRFSGVRRERQLSRLEIQRLREHVIRVQEEERSRFAHELHDEASQAITGVLLALRGLEERVGADVRVEVARVREQLRAVVTELKRIARGLHPGTLEDLGLVPALQELLDEVRDHHGLEVDLVSIGIDKGARLPRPTELAIYRIIQESVANVVRHARARSISVIVEHRGACLGAVVEDDGKGFDVEQALGREGPSVGLKFMRERAALLGGTLTAESRPGGGTAIHFTLPSGGGQP